MALDKHGGVYGEHDLSHAVGAAAARESMDEAAHRRYARQADEPGITMRLAMDHGLSEASVREIIGDYEESMGKTENMALAAQYQAMKDWMHDLLHLMRRTLQNQKTTHPDSLRTIDTAALAMGFTDVCNASAAADLARQYGVPKETVNKAKLEFQKKAAMPPAPEQRTEAQRLAMAAARVKAIKQKQQ